MIRAAVIAVLMLTAAVTGAVAFDHYRPKPTQQVILQPIHTVERIIHEAKAKTPAKARTLVAAHRAGRVRSAPVLGKRHPGDDSANELNLRELR